LAKWVLVSGAGSGIGRAIAMKMARRGFSPILLGRTLETLEGTRAILDGVEHRIMVGDIRDKAALNEGLKKLGIVALHGLVANAGVGGENVYGENDRWDEIISTNLTGSYNLINECLPYLRADREESVCRHIVMVSSVLARLGVPGYSAYCASKAGLLGLMRSYAQAFAPEGILVNAICPGWVATAMAKEGMVSFAETTGKNYKDVFEEQMGSVPLGKMSEPREVAELVFFLLSRVQNSITGQTLDMNNGAVMA